MSLNPSFNQSGIGLSQATVDALTSISPSTIAGINSVPSVNWQFIKNTNQNVSNTSTPTFTGATVKDGSFTVQNTADVTKELSVDCSSIPTGTAQTLTMANHSIDLNSVNFTGFTSWGGSGDYYSIVGDVFTLLRPVSGYCNGKAVTASAPQSPANMTAGLVNYIYVDASGVIQTTTTRTLPLYQANILLFEILYDTGSGLIVKNEQHVAGQNVVLNDMIHDNVGSVIEPSGGMITVGTDPRAIQITAGTYNDQDINFTFIATDPIPIQLWYLNASGKWTYDATYTNDLVLKYTIAGVLTTDTTNNHGVIYRLYITNHFATDGTLTPAYIGVVDTQTAGEPYSNLANAQSAITSNKPQIATNELFDTELAQLGFIIMRWQTGGIITVESIVVSKSTYAQNVSGGTAGSSHLTLSDLNGGQYIDGGHSNLAQAVAFASAPTATDDTVSYKKGAIWTNTATKNNYLLADDTAGSAVWNKITQYSGVDQAVNTTSTPTFASAILSSAGTTTLELISSEAPSGTDYKIYTGGTGKLTFQHVGVADRMSIDNAGTVNVVVTTESTATNTGCLVLNGGLGVAKSIYSTSVKEANGAVGSPSYSFATDTTSGMYLSSSNNVNISTNSISRVQVGTSAVSIDNADLSVTATNLYIGNTPTKFSVTGTTGDTAIAGKVGIGQAVGTEKLEVTGSVKSTVSNIVNSATEIYFDYKKADKRRFITGVTNTIETGSNAGSDFWIVSYDDAETYLSTPLGINRATGKTTLTSLEVTGTVTLPNATAIGALVLSSTVGGNFTAYAMGTTFYQAIGKWRLFTFEMTWSDKGGASGSVIVTGLPFTLTGEQVLTGQIDNTASYSAVPLALNTTSYMQFFRPNSTGGLTGIDVSEIPATGTLRVSGTVYVA